MCVYFIYPYVYFTTMSKVAVSSFVSLLKY